MIEEQWRASGEPRKMLRFLIGTDAPRVVDVVSFPDCRVGDRGLRLFACGCYARLSHLLPEPLARAAVLVAERFADGEVGMAELRQADAEVRARLDALEGRWRASRGAEREALLPTHEALALAFQVVRTEAPKAAYYASSNAALAFASLMNPGAASSDADFTAAQIEDERAQAEILRCIFGNPYRQVDARSEWICPEVTALARRIYDEKAFAELSGLADDLEKRGCDEPSILAHCRSDRVHARGCWVVDLLLGRG